MKRTERMIIVAIVLMMALLLAVSIVGAAVAAHDTDAAVDLAWFFQKMLLGDDWYVPHPPIKGPIIWPPPPKL